MQRFRFPLAVLGTSVALVAVLVGLGAFVAGSAIAAGVNGWRHAGGDWVNLPPELSGLRDIPATDRFAHFRGVQVNLTDKDNHPLTVSVTPLGMSCVQLTVTVAC